MENYAKFDKRGHFFGKEECQTKRRRNVQVETKSKNPTIIDKSTNLKIQVPINAFGAVLSG